MPKRTSPEEFNVNYNRYCIVYEWILYSGVTGEAIKLYGALQRFSNSENAAWPSMATLAERVGMCERSVRRYLAELVEIDAVRVENRSRANGSTTSSIYHLWPYEKPEVTRTNLSDLTDNKEVTRTPAPVTRTDLSPPDRTLYNEHQPIIKKGRPRKKPEPNYTPEFEEFFSLYPKPLNKEQTFKTRGASVDDIMGAARAYIKEIERKGTDPDFMVVSSNFVGQKQRWTEHQVLAVSEETLKRARAWDSYDSNPQGDPAHFETAVPEFPRPTDARGNLLDGNGLAYYIDPMDFKRRYVDDE
jgi:hypothetical protein